MIKKSRRRSDKYNSIISFFHLLKVIIKIVKPTCHKTSNLKIAGRTKKSTNLNFLMDIFPTFVPLFLEI